MKIVTFSLEQGNKYFGEIDGTRFFIGSRVSYQGGKGLANSRGDGAQRYDRAKHRAAYGFWADFIHPTAAAEGGLYHTLNTYDRARFTFTFLQFAAHVPNGDFVLYLRTLLKLPLAAEYFPDLRLEGGRIVRRTDAGSVALETDASTAGLLDYLNPSRTEVEDTEVIQAARFVHWAQNDPAHRAAQVEVGVKLFRRKMAEYAERYGLDGADDAVCLVVADIRHQGRARSPEIIAALKSSTPLESLLKIGKSVYPERIAVLRREIDTLVEEGVLGTMKYDASASDFVPRSPLTPAGMTAASELNADDVAGRVDAALAAFANVAPLSHADALRRAFTAYYRFRRAHPKDVRKPYLYFVDFGLDNRKRRGWVLDMDALKPVEGPFAVAHGGGSSDVRNAVPKRFSNVPGSNATSLGLYLAAETYDFNGKSGSAQYTSIGLRMDGKSGRFNDKARSRGVVVHGAPYVTDGDAGRSDGCPAMEQGRAKRLLPLLAKGGVVFHFSPNDADWMGADPWANG